jgi:hypothetical protein
VKYKDLVRERTGADWFDVSAGQRRKRAVEMGADAEDIGKTIHPHPTLGESVGMADELYEGVCTDLPPQRKK